MMMATDKGGFRRELSTTTTTSNSHRVARVFFASRSLASSVSRQEKRKEAGVWWADEVRVSALVGCKRLGFELYYLNHALSSHDILGTRLMSHKSDWLHSKARTLSNGALRNIKHTAKRQRRWSGQHRVAREFRAREARLVTIFRVSDDVFREPRHLRDKSASFARRFVKSRESPVLSDPSCNETTNKQTNKQTTHNDSLVSC